MAGAILEDLVTVLRSYIGVLLKIADAIALLDMLWSLALGVVRCRTLLG